MNDNMTKKDSSLTVFTAGVTLTFFQDTLCCRVEAGGGVWEQACPPRIEWKDRTQTLFADALSISHRYYRSGVGTGILSSYDGFAGRSDFSFETLVWIEGADSQYLGECGEQTAF